MSDTQEIINKTLSGYPVEDRPIILQMMNDKLTGKKTSKRDYKKLIKVQKRIRKARVKNGR
jgi:hypothetical protein